MLSLRPLVQTLENSDVVDAVLVESVFHDVSKYLALLVEGIGYVIADSLAHRDLAFVRVCGARRTRAAILDEEDPARALRRLQRDAAFARPAPPAQGDEADVIRVSRTETGIHALRTGEVEANLIRLNEIFQFDFVNDLVDMKRACEHLPVAGGGHPIDWYLRRAEESQLVLAGEAERFSLPSEADIARLDDLLYAIRVAS